MGYTKEQIAFFEKYEKQINKLLEENYAEKRRNSNDKKAYDISLFFSILFVITGVFLFYLFKCKIVLSDFNLKTVFLEACFGLAIWGLTNVFAYLLIRSCKYKFYSYCIATGVTFLLSYIFVGLFHFEFVDDTNNYSIISAILFLILFILYIIIAIRKGDKLGLEKSREIEKMNIEYYKAFIEPKHYDNSESLNKKQKKSRRKNRTK